MSLLCMFTHVTSCRDSVIGLGKFITKQTRNSIICMDPKIGDSFPFVEQSPIMYGTSIIRGTIMGDDVMPCCWLYSNMNSSSNFSSNNIPLMLVTHGPQLFLGSQYFGFICCVQIELIEPINLIWYVFGNFTNENVGILIKVSLKFVPKGPIDNNSALV